MQNDAATLNAQTTSVRLRIVKPTSFASDAARLSNATCGLWEGLKLTNSETSLFANGSVDAINRTVIGFFLDTKPGLSPATPAEISNAIKPY